MWRSLIRIINCHVLKQIMQYGYNNIELKRIQNGRKIRTDLKRIVNGPFRFIKRQREGFLAHTVCYNFLLVCGNIAIVSLIPILLHCTYDTMNVQFYY